MYAEGSIPHIRAVTVLPLIAVVSLLSAGLTHLVLYPQHYSHAPAHGIFFVIAGALEIVWAFAFWRWPSRSLYVPGIALAGNLLVLWALTRVARGPFSHGLEPVDPIGLAVKAFELVGILALTFLVFGGVKQRPALRVYSSLAWAALLALAMSAGIFFAGRGVEPLVPNWGASTEEHLEHPSSNH